MSTSGLHATGVLNITLWAAQVLLALSFVWAAYKKLLTPIPDLAKMWPWVATIPAACVRLLGIVDLAGGVGVVAPMATGILPGLTVAAALGCVALQVCAMIFHLSRKETGVLPVNLVFLALAGFVAWGRM